MRWHGEFLCTVVVFLRIPAVLHGRGYPYGRKAYYWLVVYGYGQRHLREIRIMQMRNQRKFFRNPVSNSNRKVNDGAAR